MSSVKDRLYNYFVRSNGRIWYEYERYVREHIEEHKRKRLKHLLILAKLNWFYRVRHGNRPYLYPDVPLAPVEPVKPSAKLPYKGSESEAHSVRGSQHLVKKLYNYDVISFDVFDTLIFRPVNPRDVFKILEYNNGIQHFSTLREKTEKELRNREYENHGTREISLYDIYLEIERKTGLPVEKGMTDEIEVEINLCYANPYMQNVYNMLIALNKTIIFTSDMYLSKDTIGRILCKNGYKKCDDIFISCEYKKSKAVGDIYSLIKKCYPNQKIAHVGDNKISDVKMAGNSGIDAFHYKNINECGNKYRADGISPLFSSAYSCIVNNKIYCGNNKFPVEYELGYIYGGFYVLGYINWIHRFALENSIDKIIFLSRDGEIYKRVYDSLFDDIKSEYLICSRSLIARCSIKKNRYDFLRRFVYYRALNQQKYTVLDLCKDVGLESKIDEIERYYNIAEDSLITLSNYEMIINFLIANIEIVERHFENEELALQLYVKSIIGSSNKVAIVDVGWEGSGPKNLKEKIENEWQMNCKVYGLLAIESCQIPQKDIYAYIFSNRMNRIHYDSHYKTKTACINNDLFEMFTQAPSPSVKRIYINEKNEVEFEFAAPIVEGYKQISLIHQGVLDFAIEYTERFKNYKFMHEICGYDAYCPFRELKRDISYFKEIMGTFPVETDTGGSLMEPVSTKEYIERKGI